MKDVTAEEVTVDAVVVRAMFTAEQAATVDLARDVAPEQWARPSLCSEWSVRDVLAHAARHIHSGGWRETTDISGKRAARRERALTEATVEGMIDALAAPAPAATRGLRGMAKLNTCELVIHQQDVRRPLGMERAFPEATLRMCLDFTTTPLGNLGVADRGRRLGRGLRLVANDVAWSKGTGPCVTGTAEAILMAIAGRPAAAEELTGPGQPVLAARLGATTMPVGADSVGRA